MKNLMGMGGMSDQVIATDFLISAKAGVRNIPLALMRFSRSQRNVKGTVKNCGGNSREDHELYDQQVNLLSA